MGTKSKKRVGALALCAAIGCSALCAGSGSITSLRAKTGTAEAEAQTHENALSEQNEIPENANYAADGNGAHVLRVVPCCCLTGQAAGIAAAVAIEQNKSVADVYDMVKPRLASSGVAFEIK